MNSIQEFASWRPDVHKLDDEAVERIWSAIVSDTAAAVGSRPGPPVEVDGYEDVVVTLGTRPPTGRRWTLVAAAAAVAVCVAGIAAFGRSAADEPGESAASDPGALSDGGEADRGWVEFAPMPIAPRFQYAAVSTGSGIFVWGGCCADGTGDVPLIDGAYYDGDSWRVVPEAPLDPRRGDAIAVWTGREVIVMNGVDGVTAAAFDPDTFRWRSLAPPEMRVANNGGTRLLLIEPGRLALVHGATVALYDIGADTWSTPITVDGIEVVNPVDDSPPVLGYGATGHYIAVATTTDINPCSGLRIRVFDVTSASWTSIDPRTGDWLPADLVGLPDGRILITGGSQCADDSSVDSPRAMVLEPATGNTEWVTAPPVSPNGFRYGGIVADDAVVYLDPSGALLVYRPGVDTWALGPSLLRNNPNTDAKQISETPLLWFEQRIVVLSPGYADEEPTGTDAWSCCYPTGDAWALTLTDATIPDTAPPATGPHTDNESTQPAPPPPAPTGRVVVATAPDVAPAAAEALSERLLALGFDTLAAPPIAFDQATTFLFVRSGFDELAHALADIVGIDSTATEPLTKANTESLGGVDPEGVDVMVVLASDLSEPAPQPNDGIDEPSRATIPSEPVDFLAIGDSVMLGAAPELASRGYAVNAEVSRQMNDSVPLIQELADNHVAGDVVIHLGNHGPITSDTLEAFLAPLSDVPNIVILNVHTDRPWAEPNNSLLAAYDQPGDNIILIDWNTIAATCPGDCFAADGIHLTEDGRRFYADTIGDYTGL